MTALDSVLENIRSREVEARDLLCDLIRFPSVHGHEGDIQRFLQARFAAQGLDANLTPILDRIKDDPEYSRPEQDLSFQGRPNLVVRKRGRGQGRSIVLNCHTDVVPASTWERAYDPVVEGDRVIGRGACDNKGAVAALYLLLTALQRTGLNPGGDVIGEVVIDEEVGGNGTLALIRDGVRADGAIVLESSEFHVHPANRGAIWFRITVEGKAVHMGRISEGISAIDLAHQVIGILRNYEKQLMADVSRHPLFRRYERPAQVNIGTLHAGDWPATVPGKAVMEGGIGFLPNRCLDDIRRQVREIIDAQADPWLKQHYTLEFPKLHNEAFETPTDHPLVTTLSRACERQRGASEISGMIVSCDARLLHKVGGMLTVVFGPGLMKDAHSNHERIDMKDIVKAAQILAVFLAEWCGEA